MVSCLESFGPKMLVISALITDRQTIKGCEPWGGIEVLPAIFSRVVLANFSVTGKLDGLFQGPRGGNLQFQFQKKTDSTEIRVALQALGLPHRRATSTVSPYSVPFVTVAWGAALPWDTGIVDMICSQKLSIISKSRYYR